jgi:hypothetical protein
MLVPFRGKYPLYFLTKRINPEYSRFKDPNSVNNLGVDDIDWMNQHRNRNNFNKEFKATMTSLPDEMLYLTWPSVAGIFCHYFNNL